MKKYKEDIIKNVCYTDLVYDRINKKLNANYSPKEIEDLILKILNDTDYKFFSRKGKNIYVSSMKYNIRITINSNTNRIITVDRIKKA